MKRRIKKQAILKLLFIIIILFSTIKILIWFKSTKKNKNIKEEIQEYIKIEKTEKEEKYIVDFKKLKEQNNETIAYLKVNNTNINYVVVKTKDNDYYINHDFNKEYNVAGWIFADYKNNFDGNDKNIIIYGHNMKDGSMFAPLKEILTSNWQNNTNKQITLITENNTITYEIFSSYTINPEEYYLKTNFKDDEAFLEFINTLKQRSFYDYNIDLNEKDNVLTLSTCTGTGNNRIVIHAKQIKLEQN